MKREYYRGFFTNGTVGKIIRGDKIYLIDIKSPKKNINNNENNDEYHDENDDKYHDENENKKNSKNKDYNFMLKKMNYCYSKRRIDNIINFKSIEKRKMVCMECNRKYYDPINDLHNYKTKSKKKSK